MTRKPLDRERWQLLESILDQVFDAPAEQRDEILDRACGGDTELRAEVGALLVAEARSGPLDREGSDHATLIQGAVAEASGSSLEGSRLGPYRVDQVLGTGGMGIVYDGWDTRLERAVAIKVLPAGFAQGEAKERFLREARAASALDHPNICSIHDIGSSDDGRPYLVMARYQGETLRQRLDRGPLSIDEGCALACQVARGLDRAHAAGIVHRDIKPGNIFITEHGEVKILDFGLAKMADDAGLTLTGALIGTPAYMAPEQVRGESVDARTDIWAFGVVLFEMMAGRRPFRTGKGVGSLFAALEVEPDLLTRFCADAPSEIVDLLNRCLAKDPAARPQTMGQILRALGEPSSAHTSRPMSVHTLIQGSARRRLTVAVIVFSALFVALFMMSPWQRRDSSEKNGVVGNPQGTPGQGMASVARPTVGLVVLNFHNLTADPDIDDLGPVITEMLVTDLRGSPDLDVAGTSNLHRTLAALGVQERSAPTAELIGNIASETGKETVLHGSFTRLGTRFRLLATLERPASGKVLMSKQVEAAEQDLFNAVDELSLAVRSTLEAGTVDGGSDGVRGVTTDSLDAMRFYSEGLLFYYDQSYLRSIEALEKSVELDPRFALAWRRLGVVYSNVGRKEDSRQALARAFELADRLPPKQRFVVQADHYGSRWSTLGKSIEIYERALSLYPNETSWHNNLGYTYAQIERYDDALAQYQESIGLGTAFGYAYVNSALISTALGRSDHGLGILKDFADRHPGDWAWQDALGRHYLAWGRFDEAVRHLDQAQSLVADPQPKILHNFWKFHTLKSDWAAADAVITDLEDLHDARPRYQAAVNRARGLLLRGQAESALDALRRAGEVTGWQPRAKLRVAEVLLYLGRPEEALVTALDTSADAEGRWRGLRAEFVAALAEEALGRSADADQRWTKLEAEASNRVERRQVHHLAGLLAAARGDLPKAVSQLQKAADLLSKRGVAFGSVEPQHVAIWLDCGRAAMKSGDLEAAKAWLQAAADAGTERLFQPVAWGRSLFWLGEVHFQLGETDEARRRFQDFENLWNRTDLDPDLLKAARERLGEPARVRP